MKIKLIIASIALLAVYSSCAQSQKKEKTNTRVKKVNLIPESGEAVATFAEGCFWCVEEVFESLEGVREVVSGYSGGSEKNPTYEDVGSGLTSHAESVQVYYNPSKISYEQLVRAFFASHDPTTLNRQGPDEGTQYRSIAFYRDETEKAIIQKVMIELTLAKKYNQPIVSEVKAFDVFYAAEDYHQDYIVHNPGNPYVQGVSVPRFEKFKKNYTSANFKK